MIRTAGCGNDPLEGWRRTLLLGSLAALVAAAWVTLWLWSDGSHASWRLLFHTHASGHHDPSSVHTLPLVIVGWTVMMIAMMLPTSLPVLGLLWTVAASRTDRVLLVLLGIVGYLCVWTGFGAIVYTVQLTLGGVIELNDQSRQHAWSGASILLLAGVYQFTPLKYRCLEKCRSPLMFVLQHWQGHKERWLAFRLGLDHGFFCVGCCWALMLLMFVTGLGSLSWMFLLAAVMAVEKNVTWGQRLTAPLGILLVAAGIVLAART